jgi:uncharacterized protein (TIGR03437 family)
MSGAAEWDKVVLYLDGAQVPFYPGSNSGVAYAVVPIHAQGRLNVELRLAGSVVASGSAEVRAAAPAFFISGGVVAASNAAGTINRLRRGTVVSLYATGEGFSPTVIRVRFRPLNAAATEASGWDAELLYAGTAPGMPGVLQMNIRLPESLPTGEVGVELAVGDTVSPRARVVLE